MGRGSAEPLEVARQHGGHTKGKWVVAGVYVPQRAGDAAALLA